MSATIKRINVQEKHRQRRLRLKNTLSAIQASCARGQHGDEKRADGNNIYCGKCDRLIGFVRDPKKLRQS